MSRLTLSSFQWMVFILAGTIVAPVSVAFAYGFSAEQTAELLQRTFFVMGLTSLLQGLFGHKLPLMEGPAGLWWGVFLAYAGGAAIGEKSHTILSSLELGLFVSGVLFLVLTLLNLIDSVKKLFTPTIIGTYLILLILQLSGPFVEGILGAEGGKIDSKVAVIALITLIIAIVLSQFRVTFFKNYSVLFSLIIGWILFAVFGLTDNEVVATHKVFSVPQWFVWGKPTFNLGVVITACLTGLLLLTNLIASVDAVKQVVRPEKDESLRRTSFIMGINQILAGIFPTIGGVPISGSAGFILTTRIKERLPFLIGSLIILVLSFFPVIMGFFAALPAPVGYATLFLSMAGIIGLGLNALKGELHKEKKVTVATVSIMAGTGILLLPQTALADLPNVVSSILHNGLVVGVVIAVILDQTIGREKPTPLADKNQA
ncbi:purine permease [Pullulanibacillus camelliae]|uniref:Purine permease n=1 Tax=Pullulanibacillus camelliae TaxID=1707096 RepID=A0A8J2YL31_9BACL|nr:purine/pyrimidine permease [Pullulanibacillus camelliae]GGE50098.1 purine permease [Pullulanibacillus camelliae]